MAFCALLYGHIGSFVTLFRCVLCDCPKERFGKNEPISFRFLDTIKEAAKIYKNEYVPSMNPVSKRQLYIKTKAIPNEPSS